MKIICESKILYIHILQGKTQADYHVNTNWEVPDVRTCVAATWHVIYIAP